MANGGNQTGQQTVGVLVVDHRPPLLNAIVRMLQQSEGVQVFDAVLRPAQAVR